MPKKPEPPASASPVEMHTPISEIGSSTAPILYFENVPTFGNMGNVLRLTLTADRIYPSTPPGQIVTDQVIVAHLRASIPSAIALRDAINSALLLATPPESSAKN